MKINVHVNYSINNDITINLENKQWEDVREYWVMWDKLHIIFNDSLEIHKYDLNTLIDINWKRPSDFIVTIVNEKSK